VKVHDDKLAESILAYNLRPGQVAEIVGCPQGASYRGWVVQRVFGNRLQALGRDECWSETFEAPNENFRVRILKPGTLLEV
jgi:hypothetical protein